MNLKEARDECCEALSGHVHGLGCLAAAVCMAPRAAAGQRFTIAYTGGIGVYPRSGPSMGSQRVGAALPEGSSVEVACELEGELVDNNTTPATKIWERLSDGTYVSNAYTNTGVEGWTPGVSTHIFCLMQIALDTFLVLCGIMAVFRKLMNGLTHLPIRVSGVRDIFFRATQRRLSTQMSSLNT